MSTAQLVLTAVGTVVVFALGIMMGRGDRRSESRRDVAPEGGGGSPEGATPRAGEPADHEVTAADAGLLARLTHALDRIDQGVIVCDRSGTEIYRNRAAEAFARARDPLVLVDAAVREAQQIALAGRTHRREVDLFGPPAQTFLVEARPLELADVDLGGALVLVEDRTDQRRTETVRRDFVANISHELKTPIGALGLLAETIRDEPDPGVVERLARRMVSEADRASRTVDDLLELSRIELGADSELEPTTVAQVVGEAVARIASAADHAGISVLTDVPPELVVVVDRRQVVSALYNLLDNAVKYSPEGSEVEVAARLDPLDHQRVELSVADGGIGIPRRDLDRVFERFYRVDRARSRDTGGTGLGLAIVRHVMNNHGGEVSVESTEGVGTRFALTLPARTEEPTSR